MLLRIAYRNIWRNRRRTLITVTSVAGGMMFSLLFTGLQDGGYDKLINSSARIGSGHVTFENLAYREDPDIKNSIADYRSYLAQLRGVDGIVGTSLRISAQGMLSSSHGAAGVYFDALQPRSERSFTPMLEKIIAGEYLDESSANGVILGETLARKLKVEVGNKVVLTLNNRDNRTVQELLNVKGIFRTGSDAMDGFYFQMPLDFARRMLGFGEHEVLQVAVYLRSQRQADTVAGKVNARLADDDPVRLLPWHKVMQDLANYIAMDNAFNYVLQILAFLIIAAGILNTVLMSVMERRFEFGVMLAIGTAPRSLFAMIVTETAYIGVLGVFFGSLLGWTLNLIFARFPIDLSHFMSDEMNISGYAMEPVLRTGLFFDHYLTTCMLVYALVLLVGLYPAAKAARTVPVRALTGT